MKPVFPICPPSTLTQQSHSGGFEMDTCASGTRFGRDSCVSTRFVKFKNSIVTNLVELDLDGVEEHDGVTHLESSLSSTKFPKHNTARSTKNVKVST